MAKPGEESRSAAFSEELVDGLVLEALDLCERGDSAGAEALLRAHPQMADAVRRRLHTLARAGFLAAPGPISPALPERIGPFRLLELLGGGGMGEHRFALGCRPMRTIDRR